MRPMPRKLHAQTGWTPPPPKKNPAISDKRHLNVIAPALPSPSHFATGADCAHTHTHTNTHMCRSFVRSWPRELACVNNRRGARYAPLP